MRGSERASRHVSVLERELTRLHREAGHNRSRNDDLQLPHCLGTHQFFTVSPVYILAYLSLTHLWLAHNSNISARRLFSPSFRVYFLRILTNFFTVRTLNFKRKLHAISHRPTGTFSHSNPTIFFAFSFAILERILLCFSPGTVRRMSWLIRGDARALFVDNINHQSRFILPKPGLPRQPLVLSIFDRSMP